MTDVTFYMPCLNEERAVGKSLETVKAAASDMKLSYEVIVFDDGSTDDTSGAVRAFRAEHPDVDITLKRNPVSMGLGRNYVEGAYIGKGEHYMMVCGDDAEPKESIVAILGRLGDADMVIPYFGENDSRGFARRALSRTFVFLVNVLSGNSIRYYNGLVLHKRYNVMRWHPDTQGFAYQAETITRMLEEGKTYVEVPIANQDRQFGSTKAFSFENVLSVLHSLLQIFLRRLRGILFHRKQRQAREQASGEEAVREEATRSPVE